MSRQTVQAFVLHRRPWRETSFLVELLTADMGRVGAVARGATGRRGSWKACLQPFRPLLVSLGGKGDLLTVVNAEEQGLAAQLTGERLYCGLYVNEILLRLLARHDAHPTLFQAYADTLADLPRATYPAVVLRYFELHLLAELGFGLELECEAESGQAVQSQYFYDYDPESGLRQVTPRQGGRPFFTGAGLLALARGDLSDGQHRREARLLLQRALAPHLGQRPLVSRQLMRK